MEPPGASGPNKMKTSNISHRKLTVLFYAVWVMFAVSVGFNLIKDDGTENLFMLQAQAFAEGRLDISEPVNDTAIYQGKYYVTFPPFPAFVLTPLVAVFGNVNTTLVALILSIVLGFVLFSVFRRIGSSDETNLLLIMAMIFGTGYWFVTKFSFGVWSFAHVVAVLMLFLAIREGFGQKRAWVMAAFLGCAFLSRQLAVYSAVFFLAILTEKHEGKTREIVKDYVVFGLVFAGFAGIYLWMNYARFGNPFDTGYYYIAGDPLGLLGEKRYGLFHYMYVPFNFTYMFFQGPHMVFEGLKPAGMDFYGTSITFASPFVFIALQAKGKKLLKAGAWISISLALIHMLFYCNNGWVQINTQRFTLDFLPVLMVLVALGSKRIRPRWLYLSVGVAVVLNMVAFIVLPLLTRLF